MRRSCSCVAAAGVTSTSAKNAEGGAAGGSGLQRNDYERRRARKMRHGVLLTLPQIEGTMERRWTVVMPSVQMKAEAPIWLRSSTCGISTLKVVDPASMVR